MSVDPIRTCRPKDSVRAETTIRREETMSSFNPAHSGPWWNANGVAAALATVSALWAVPGLAAPEFADVGPSRIARLVVLAPRAAWSEDCLALAFGRQSDASLEDRCRLIEMLADDIRSVAAATESTGNLVMDRNETMRRMRKLRRPPRCPTPDLCDLDTARLLDAKYVVSAHVRVAGESWSARLELRDVSRGLLASAEAIARSGTELRASVRRAARRLLRAGLAPRSANP
jgi:hypothetical protein